MLQELDQKVYASERNQHIEKNYQLVIQQEAVTRVVKQ